MDAFFHVGNWPLVVVSLGMIACAIIDWWKFKVPNYLTFPLILSGWLLGLVHNFFSYFDYAPAWGGGQGGIGAALAGTFFGFGLLFPMLAIRGVGEGDVKMTMGFGSWIGAFFGFEGSCLWIVFYTFCAGAIIGGLISMVMMAVRGEYQKNLEHTRVILMDLITVGSVSKIAQRAAERKPRWHKLPYGIPLCLGFVGYLVLASYLAAKQPEADEQPSSQSTAAKSSVYWTRTAPGQQSPCLGQNPQS
jgi:prepilin peptidase CpaA